MLLRRFYDESLAQASYLVGCQATGDAIVVDANRDIEQYVRAAEEEGLRLSHVTETHIHADFVSGSRELAERAGAQLYLSAEGGKDWRYAFAGSARARLLYDGDLIAIGNVRLEARHTPGHTPEHLSFIMTDVAATDRPMGALTGDFIFVGDVGRPDLLERAANMAGTMDASARTLFASLREFASLPDYLQLWPGHGAGSACGKALGAMPSTTLGYERIANWGLATTDEDEFVRMVLEGQPEPPKYFAYMKQINRDGPPILGGIQTPRRIDGQQIAPILEDGALVVDTREAASFAAHHLVGTINIPLNRSFTTWAGSLIPYDREFFLLTGGDDPTAANEAARRLAMIDLECDGWFGSDTFDESTASGARVETTPQVSAGELSALLRENGAIVLDVRGDSEWESGHLPGVRNIPLGQLIDRLGELPRHVPIVVHCQSGGRSVIAASILAANGFAGVTNLTGGFAEWKASELPIERS